MATHPQGSRRTNVPSPRELQCLALAALGNTNKKIGQHLFLSEDTIKTHMREIYYKLGANDRAHAVWLAVRAGYLNPKVPGQHSWTAPGRAS